MVEKLSFKTQLRLLCVLQRLNHRFGAGAFFVAFQEKFGANHAVGSDNIGAGVGNAARASGCFFVANAVGVDRLAARVGEQRIRDRFFRRELLQDFRGIVADGYHLPAGCLNLIQIGLQLNQLPLAEGSPLGRSEKYQRYRTLL